MKCYKRIITFFLAFAMLVSMLPFASAAEPTGVLEDSASVTAWNTYIAGNLKTGVSASSAQTAFWRNRDQVLSNAGIGGLESYDQLVKATRALNRSGGGLIQQLGDFISDAVSSLFSSPDYLVMYDSSFGCFRPYDNRTGFWVVNSMGHFPYYPVESPDGSTDDPDPIQLLTFQWIRGSNVTWDGAKAIFSYSELKEIALLYDGFVYQRGNYLHIKNGQYGVNILCSEEGYPLTAIADVHSTAVGTPNNYYTDEGDTITNNTTNITNIDEGDTSYNQFIDITNNTTWFPDGTLQYIDNLYYDESTKTYYVDSHDAYTYNETTNTYVTNNYRYEFNYHIDYTSVTYIGQTEEYEDEYRYYYQLPDGRSSADLTAEDLEQLSLVFSDVVQYTRAADNIDQRALYHFDGNTEDSSFWSYCSSFDWLTGASLTYMDEGTFGGSLYLDETEHDFTITLPNNDAAGDWTLQFRYYQSQTLAPQTDSYLKVGDHVVLQFTGAEYLDKSGAAIAATSIGTWNEICLIRSGGVLYYYINGVYLGSAADNIYHSNTISFHFGADQQTYKKLDELRFTSAVVYSPGVDYTPSAVPFDSNLTLVLPDSGTLEEQGFTIVPSENNLFASAGLDDWTSLDVVEKLHSDINAFQYGEVDGYTYPDPDGGPYLVYNAADVTFSGGNNSVQIAFSGTSINSGSLHNGKSHLYPKNELFLPVLFARATDTVFIEDYSGCFGFEPGIYYTLTVVLSDGSYDSITFTPVLNAAGWATITSFGSSNTGLLLSEGRLGCSGIGAEETDKSLYGIIIAPSVSLTADIVYMELVEGTQPEFQFARTYSSSGSDPVDVIPDEFTTITKPVSGNLLEGVDLDDWASTGVTDSLHDGSCLTYDDLAYSIWLAYDSSYVSFSDGGNSVLVDFGGNTVTRSWKNSDESSSYYSPQNALFLPIVRLKDDYGNYVNTYGFSFDADYTFSVVLSDGTHSSVTFRLNSSDKRYYAIKSSCSESINSVIDFEPVLMGDHYNCEDAYFGIAIYPSAGTTADILYMELVQDSEPHFSVGHQTSVYASADLSKSPILAVRTNQTITGYQFGGVRPSYPQKGQIWAMIENSRIRSLQQYTGSAWVEVDGRIWTGERWIPYSSYDVFLLKDCYDILGSVTDPDYEYIYTDSGFWAWFQKQWLAFMAKIDAIIVLLGGDLDSLPGGDSGNDSDLTFMERLKKIFEDSLASILESLLDLITKILDLVLGVVYDLLDFFFGLITDAVTEGIGSFFDALTDEMLLQFFHSEEPLLDSNGLPVLDENGNPVMVSVIALPSGIAAVFAFISATIMLLPEKLLSAVFFGLGVSFLLAVLKVVKS